MTRPTVALCAVPDGANVRLAESLFSNLCFVKILSEDKKLWDSYLAHIQQRNLFEIIDHEKDNEFINFDYLLLNNFDLTFSLDETLRVARLAASQSARILVVLPYIAEGVKAWQKREKIRGGILKKIPEAGIVYAGELFGPRYLGSDKNFLTRNLTSAFLDWEIEEEVQVAIFPISTDAFSRYMTRSMFSFGPYGKELAVYSGEFPAPAFSALLAQEVAGTELVKSKFGDERHETLGVKQVLIKEDFERKMKETVSWFKTNFPKPRPVAGRLRKNLPFLKKGAVVGATLLFLAPYLLGVIGATASFSAASSIKKGKTSFAKKSLTIAKRSFQNAHEFFSVYSRIPLASIFFKPFVKESQILASAAELGESAVQAFGKAQNLIEFVLGDEPYDPGPVSEELAGNLDALYQEISFLESDLKEAQTEKSFLLKFIRISEIEGVRQKLLGAKVIIGSAPEILGKGKPKTYLVLFQNNMELRPAGGFIGSFALVSFDAGRLVDINVMDVYAADGQLKGHVEPPAPIKKYLGEANWFLRDSNWDPDFPTSAIRAEWFLDKEIDRSVDGVIGADLEIVKGILKATGPVVLSDFNQTLDYANVYQRLQSEVESDFFPGSQKKAGILTALVRELMNRLSSLSEGEYLPVAREIYESFEGRHAQIYFNDEPLQEAISQMGYSGELERSFDWVAPVDANVGVTKANYFIQREHKLDVSLAEGTVKKTLEITYYNSANPALGLSGRYRTYTRVFAPAQSVFEKIKIENVGAAALADPEIESSPGRVAAGVNLEISPGQTKKLIFSWETPLPETSAGEYRLLIRKQAGTVADAIQVNVLTPREAGSYNTLLTRDFLVRSSF